jgi:hypothetical protein
MTTDKARKRAVRSRMQKTGERYAAARRHVVRGDALPPLQPLQPLPPRVAEPALSEAAILKGTGRSWDDWFRILDAWGATARTHPEIARHVNAEYGIDGWWSQGVTVGYERARGMRAPNQRPEGFEVSVSKTLDMPAIDAWRAFVEPSRRTAWLDLPLRMRTGTRTMGRSARFDVPSEGTRVNVLFAPKGDDRSVVTVTHVMLDGAEDVATHRSQWRERLGRLAALGAKTTVTARRSQAS